MSKTKEISPTAEELAILKSEPLHIFSPFIDIYKAVLEMPTVMWQLFLVYLFQWYAMMCYWQNNSKSIALSVWNVTPKNVLGYEKAVEWNGLIGAFGFIVTFSIAFYLAKLAKKHGAKMIHFACLLFGAFSFLWFPTVENQYLFFAVIIGYGIAWASMMGIPYLMVVAVIPKERYGVYMGIINMMIVIPMIIQNLSFGYILKNFLDNDPRQAISFAGILLALAAISTLLIKIKNTKLSE
jgi:maltose/moltooligosaccharide transporter